jgi:uncharacterized phage protein (TIGR01671 family)
MNDRFKFRAWNQFENAFAALDYREGIAGYGIGVGEFYLIEQSHHNDIIWMQSTGLKDKNGKLIYEGDIVQINYIPALGDDVEVAPVHWNGCSYQVGKGRTLFYYLRKNDVFEVEVIGNIYEHKHLLDDN